jgi:hypothetical protein
MWWWGQVELIFHTPRQLRLFLSSISSHRAWMGSCLWEGSEESTPHLPSSWGECKVLSALRLTTRSCWSCWLFNPTKSLLGTRTGPRHPSQASPGWVLRAVYEVESHLIDEKSEPWAGVSSADGKCLFNRANFIKGKQDTEMLQRY